MVNCASLFSQILQHIPRGEFAALVRQHGAEYGAKGFACWDQFVAMLFCQLARADSLREICHGLACCLGKLIHCGVSRAPNKSTLSYANAHRPAALFEDLFWRAAQHFRAQADFRRRHKFRFRNKLLSLDASVIALCLSLFPWASFRRQKGGVKLHVLLDHDDYLPRYVLLTNAKQHEVRMARELDLPPESVVAMDRGYNDYALFGAWSRQRVWFVTRLKEGASYVVAERRPAPARSNILADEVILLSSGRAQQECPCLLRRVVVWDERNEKELVLLTNHLGFGATTIAAIYKERWQIELFFKALKQNLKIKTFVGTSENALRIQIWTALLALLLLKWMYYLSQAGWSLSTLAAMLRMNLFTYRDLRAWLNHPFETPPPTPVLLQPLLPLSGFGQPPALKMG